VADENEAILVNPFAVADEQHGWRGLDLSGNRKRKWYTVLQNEFILVTALVVLPGERSIRHTHETGELNISYIGENRPIIRWNPPGVPHGGLPIPTAEPNLETRVQQALVTVGKSNPDLKTLLEEILQREVRLEKRFDDLTRPQPGLRVAIDVLFPPFRTTIDDPAYAEKRTITGQWYD
jgi:hypothetical protein